MIGVPGCADPTDDGAERDLNASKTANATFYRPSTYMCTDCDTAFHHSVSKVSKKSYLGLGIVIL
jgi:hypothetical protein